MGSQHHRRLSLCVCVSASWQSPGCTVVKISRYNNWVNYLYSKHCVQQRNTSCEEGTCQFMSTFRMIETARLRCVCLSEETTTLGSSAGRVSAENDYYFFLSAFCQLVSNKKTFDCQHEVGSNCCYTVSKNHQHGHEETT